MVRVFINNICSFINNFTLWVWCRISKFCCRGKKSRYCVLSCS